MITKCLRFKTTLALLFACASLLITSSLVCADKCQIIRIGQTKGGGSARIEICPNKVTVPAGTCTVWLNCVTDEELNVSFQENAKQYIISTDSSIWPQENELKAGESCYIVDSLPLGRSASRYWRNPGVYKYTLEYADSIDGGLGQATCVKRAAIGVIEVK